MTVVFGPRYTAAGTFSRRPTMTDRDALREAAEHALEWFDTYLPDTDLQREMAAALAQPAEPGLSPQETFDELWTRTATLAEARGLVLEEVTRGWDGAGCLAATIQPDGTDWRRGLEASGDTPTAALTNLAARLRAEPGLDAGHYPGCDRNPCRCAGVTTKPGLTEAWARAEAALPEGWGLDVGDSLNHPAGKYEAIAEPRGRHREEEYACVYADTPAAALIALAEKLADQQGLIGGSVYGVPGRMDPS